jgi:pyruvate dehydrogenase E2 component (dihydrolipoamide acetyltransferase)
MATPIRMPQPGQMTEACTVLRWYKREGDPVARGDPLFEIETDKSNMDVEAFDSGTILAVRVAEGESVPVDTIVAWIGEPGEVVPDADPPNGRDPQPAGAPPVSRPATAPGPSPLPASGERIRISPRAARRAAEWGVDLRSIVGTGPDGRIVERDVESALRVGAVASSGMIAPSGGQVAQDGGRPLSAMRQAIARRLTESVTTVPQFAVTVAVDMTGLVALRSEARATGSAITLTDLIHMATVQTLVEFPLVNARTDGRTVWMREGVHLGIAVSVPDGLLVPVIRDADGLELAELHDRTVAAIAGARSGRLAPDDLSGSTFTVSNMGMLEVEQFTAIVNPGESAILAVASVRAEPAAFGGGLAVRRVMRMTLTADHRLVDGELAARFLNAIRRRLEDTEAWRSALALA